MVIVSLNLLLIDRSISHQIKEVPLLLECTISPRFNSLIFSYTFPSGITLTGALPSTSSRRTTSPSSASKSISPTVSSESTTSPTPTSSDLLTQSSHSGPSIFAGIIGGASAIFVVGILGWVVLKSSYFRGKHQTGTGAVGEKPTIENLENNPQPQESRPSTAPARPTRQPSVLVQGIGTH